MYGPRIAASRERAELLGGRQRAQHPAAEADNNQNQNVEDGQNIGPQVQAPIVMQPEQPLDVPDEEVNADNDMDADAEGNVDAGEMVDAEPVDELMHVTQSPHERRPKGPTEAQNG